MADIGIDIVHEAIRLEKLYKHYRLLYLKFMFLCCSDEKDLIKAKRDQYKEQRDEYKRKIKERREIAIELLKKRSI